MSWISMLARTYDNCSDLWGKLEEGETTGEIPLLMVGQSTNNAQIDVLLDHQSNIISASPVLNKPEQITVIPCTEDSIGRTANIAPHPLHDKLQYVAGDYVAFGGQKEPGWKEYLFQLSAWCSSPYKNPKVSVVKNYIKRGSLIADLVDKGVMLAENGKLVTKHSEEQKKSHLLLSISGLDQSEAFVRFRVSMPGDLVNELWLDQNVADSFNAWQRSLQQDIGLCYVSGEKRTLSTKHPAKLRHTGDKAKLISSNDTSGFTYLGRFRNEKEVVGVSYETSQKAHNMLKWLISQRGFRNDTQVFVAWGTEMQTLPNLSEDTAELFSLDEGMDGEEGLSESALYQQNLRGEYARRFRQAMAGYGRSIHDTDGVVVMGVDSATTGRLSIIFYREIAETEFLQRIESWHRQCSWLHTYKFKDKKRMPFIGAPGPRDIALAAYGANAAKNLIKATVEKLLHCIVDGEPIEPGLRNSLLQRAGNPVAMENWEWQKTLSIACAVVRKNLWDTGRGEWNMALNEKNLDRSYLFGRLLAYAQHIENYAQWRTENQHRQTNAERMMHQFTLRPATTWAQLVLRLQSYLKQIRNPRLVNWWNMKTCEIVDLLEERFTNQPLDEQYILGLSSQIMALRNNKEETKLMEEEDDDTQK